MVNFTLSGKLRMTPMCCFLKAVIFSKPSWALTWEGHGLYCWVVWSFSFEPGFHCAHVSTVATGAVSTNSLGRVRHLQEWFMGKMYCLSITLSAPTNSPLLFQALRPRKGPPAFLSMCMDRNALHRMWCRVWQFLALFHSLSSSVAVSTKFLMKGSWHCVS